MARCAGSKDDGSPCERIVSASQQHCYSHDPDRADERKRNAQRGGRRGGRGRPSAELARLQRRFEELADRVLAGEVERGVGAVAGQLLNGARACVRDGMTAREQEEFEARIAALEANEATEGERWRA
jgi:hypothetical protein